MPRARQSWGVRTTKQQGPPPRAFICRLGRRGKNPQRAGNIAHREEGTSAAAFVVKSDFCGSEPASAMVGAMWVVAVITFGSGVMAAVRLDETLKRPTA